MTELTPEGTRLIARFLAAQQNEERQRNSLVSAECEVSNSERELAKWLMPRDMEPGEKIAVWHGDSLFQVELLERRAYPPEGMGDPHITYEPKVTIRSRGKDFHGLSIAS